VLYHPLVTSFRLKRCALRGFTVYDGHHNASIHESKHRCPISELWSLVQFGVRLTTPRVIDAHPVSRPARWLAATVATVSARSVTGWCAISTPGLRLVDRRIVGRWLPWGVSRDSG
jgi:hypothetical protein